MRQEQDMRGFIKVGAAEAGRVGLVEGPALRLIRLVDGHAGLDKRAYLRLVIKLALARRYQLRLGSDGLALRLFQQQGAYDDGARSGLIRHGGRAGRMVLGLRRDHLRRQQNTIELDGSAGRHVKPFSAFWL